jgi:hypothetical protein
MSVPESAVSVSVSGSGPGSMFVFRVLCHVSVFYVLCPESVVDLWSMVCFFV